MGGGGGELGREFGNFGPEVADLLIAVGEKCGLMGFPGDEGAFTSEKFLLFRHAECFAILGDEDPEYRPVSVR